MSDDKQKIYGLQPAPCRGNFFLFGVSLFFLGLSLGVLGSTLGMRYFMPHFRPDPAKMTEMIGKHIGDDFPLTPLQEEKIRQRLRRFHQDMSAEVQATFHKIDEKKLTLIKGIAEEFTDPETKERWLRTGEDYFPRPPHEDKRDGSGRYRGSEGSDDVFGPPPP